MEVKQYTEGTSTRLMNIVSKNRKAYMVRQFDCAKEARKPHHIVGTPTMKMFKSLLWMNIIKNCPGTTEDDHISEKITGLGISSLKGKSTRHKLKPVRKDLIEIPKELIMKHHDIKLCMDTMYVNECGMLLNAVDWTIKFRCLLPIYTMQYGKYYHMLDQILRYCYDVGFVITTDMHCNGEYQGIMNKVKDNLDMKMNFTNSQDHVPEAERNN